LVENEALARFALDHLHSFDRGRSSFLGRYQHASWGNSPDVRAESASLEGPPAQVPLKS
jgi:hypothetical protein